MQEEVKSLPGMNGHKTVYCRLISFLQRFQESDELTLLRSVEQLVSVDDRLSLARVTQDRLVEGQRFAVVHQAVACADSPERSRANARTCDRPAVLHYEVARPDVVQQEIAEGTNDLAA